MPSECNAAEYTQKHDVLQFVGDALYIIIYGTQNGIPLKGQQGQSGADILERHKLAGAANLVSARIAPSHTRTQWRVIRLRPRP